jgi:aldehyde:ferredoxin oxidoreductase
MELYEMGYIGVKDVSFPLTWGDADNCIKLIYMIARGEGFGMEAALGGKHLAEKYGAPDLFMGSKGQGLAGYHPRGMVGQGLLYATSPEGGNHTTGNTIQHEINGIPAPMDPMRPEGKAEMVISRQDETAFVESCGVCVFPYMLMEEGTEIIAEFYSAVVGVDHTEDDVRKIGERIFNLERLFNQRLGFARKDDILPRRLTQEPHGDGIGEGNVVPLEEMLERYYKLRGWSGEGVPRGEKLKELGLL